MRKDKFQAPIRSWKPPSSRRRRSWKKKPKPLQAAVAAEGLFVVSHAKEQRSRGQDTVSTTSSVEPEVPSTRSPTIKKRGRNEELQEVKFVYPRASNLFGTTFSFQTGRPPSPSSAEAPRKKAVSIDDILDGRASAINGKDSTSQIPPSPGEAHPSNVRSPYLSGISVDEAVKDKIGLRPRCNSTDGELELPQRGLCDERIVLASFRWDSEFSSSTSHPRGFRNLGNTCYLNSTLQSLASCPPFCQSILTLAKANTARQQSQHNGSNNNPGKKISHALGTLFRQVYPHPKGDSHVTSRYTKSASPISPNAIVAALPSLGSIACRYGGYKFRPGRQEDAHEFLIHFLDAMHDGELRDAGIHVRKSGWRDRLPVPRLDETTFVHRIFGGYLRSQILCTSCGYRSNTYDPFLDLSLEISRHGCNSVAAAFQEYTRKETLDSSNRWKCDGCKKKVRATKQLTVFRPPLALILQLKRFTFGGSYGGNKISKPISYQASMKLPLSDGRSCEYSLTGAVIHVGHSSSSGHYTACIKRPNGRWYLMDDAHSQGIREGDALGQRNAYLLIYSRKEVKIEFPSPPLRKSMTASQAKELALVRAQERMLSLDDKPIVERSVEDDATPQKTPAVASRDDHDKGGHQQSTGQCREDSFRPKSPALVSQVAQKKSVNDFLLSSKEGNWSFADGATSKKQETSVASSSTKEKSNKIPPNGVKTSKEYAAVSSDHHSSIVLETESNETTTSNNPAIHQDAESSKVDKSTDSETAVTQNVSSALEVPTNGHSNRTPRSEGACKHSESWKPAVQSCSSSNTSKQYDLLGNKMVGQWGDGDDEEVRGHLVKGVVTGEKARKRRMFLDHHDFKLDQGKVRNLLDFCA